MLLTSFRTEPHTLELLRAKVAALSSQIRREAMRCTISGASCVGRYVFLDVAIESELRQFCSDVVLAVQPFVDNSATRLPDWVHGLPEPSRQQKSSLFKQYGSPNVFEGFDPHITLAVADLMVPLHELEELSMKVTAGLVGKEVRFGALCLGAAGEHGVVFREHSQIVR